MQDARDDIDRFFQDKFLDFHKAPPSSVWRGIRSNGFMANGNRLSSLFRLKLLFILVILAIITIAGITWFDHNDQTQQNGASFKEINPVDSLRLFQRQAFVKKPDTVSLIGDEQEVLKSKGQQRDSLSNGLNASAVADANNLNIPFDDERETDQTSGLTGVSQGLTSQQESINHSENVFAEVDTTKVTMDGYYQETNPAIGSAHSLLRGEVTFDQMFKEWSSMVGIPDWPVYKQADGTYLPGPYFSNDTLDVQMDRRNWFIGTGGIVSMGRFRISPTFNLTLGRFVSKKSALTLSLNTSSLRFGYLYRIGRNKLKPILQAGLQLTGGQFGPFFLGGFHYDLSDKITIYSLATTYWVLGVGEIDASTVELGLIFRLRKAREFVSDRGSEANVKKWFISPWLSIAHLIDDASLYPSSLLIGTYISDKSFVQLGVETFNSLSFRNFSLGKQLSLRMDYGHLLWSGRFKGLIMGGLFLGEREWYYQSSDQPLQVTFAIGTQYTISKGLSLMLAPRLVEPINQFWRIQGFDIEVGLQIGL